MIGVGFCEFKVGNKVGEGSPQRNRIKTEISCVYHTCTVVRPSGMVREYGSTLAPIFVKFWEHDRAPCPGLGKPIFELPKGP
jgi:hypothetical protein